MHFKIATDELRKALHRAQGIVERKTTMPILANVLITAAKTGVTVTAFDLDIGVLSEHPAEVLKPGAVTVSAKHLSDIVQNAPDGSITVKRLPNDYVEVTSGAAYFKLAGMAPEEYPKLQPDEGARLATVNGAHLLEMIKRTYFAVPVDESRPSISGALVEQLKGGRVRMVATDGHRLAMVERELGDLKLKAGVIVPRKGLLELRRLLDEAPEAECQLGFAENSALFKKPGLTMVMRLIDGQFPGYESVIPKEGERLLVLPRLPLLGSLRRVAPFAADKSNAVRIHLSANQLRISSSNPDLGEAHDEVECDYSGPEFTAGFNARYLSDVLSALDAETVEFELGGHEHSPCVLRPPGDRSYTAVVMPMRLP